MSTDCGFISTVKIDEEIIAGCCGYIIGEHLYLSKIAHQLKYNKYNAGQIALLKLIEWAIEQKK